MKNRVGLCFWVCNQFAVWHLSDVQRLSCFTWPSVCDRTIKEPKETIRALLFESNGWKWMPRKEGERWGKCATMQIKGFLQPASFGLAELGVGPCGNDLEGFFFHKCILLLLYEPMRISSFHNTAHQEVP